MAEEEGAPSAAAVGIFATLFALHLCIKLYARLAPSGVTPQERRLVNEIKELNRSAKDLSSPATFAKSAKLKRRATAKEKELAQFRQELPRQRGWRLPSHAIVARALKAVVHILLVLWFWRTSVATVPVALLKPADYLLNMGKRVSGDLVAVGIIPWLLMSSRASEFLSEKIVGKPPRQPGIRKLSFLQSS